MSIQLERLPYAFNGKTYELVANNAALEELEAAYEGSMGKVMEDSADHVASRFCLIMLNREAKKQGDAPIAAEDFAEAVSYAMLREMDVFGMLLRALSPVAWAAAAGKDGAGE